MKSILSAVLFLLLSLLLPACTKSKDKSFSGEVPSFSLPLQAETSLKAEIFLDPGEEKSVQFYRDIWMELKKGKADNIRREYHFVSVRAEPKQEELSRQAIRGIFCAQKQGMEEAFLDGWFSQAKPGAFPSVEQVARKSGLTLPEFSNCRNDEQFFSQRLEDEMLVVMEKNVQTVPTVLFSGTLLGGLQEKKNYEEQLERLKSEPKPDEWILWEVREPECEICGSEGTLTEIQRNLGMPARILRVEWKNVFDTAQPPFMYLPKFFSNEGIKKSPQSTVITRGLKQYGKYWEIPRMSAGVWRYYGDYRGFTERHVLGSAKASVTVFEFTDFQCPACRQFALLLFPQVQRDFIETGKLKWAIIHLPLTTIHARAFDAAMASECAGAQNAFWEYHDQVFRYQQNLSRADLIRYAANLADVKVETFTNCLNSNKTASIINQDLRLAENLQVGGTPTFFAGRYTFSSLPYPRFRQVLEKVVAESR